MGRGSGLDMGSHSGQSCFREPSGDCHQRPIGLPRSMLTEYAELGIRRRAAGYDALTMTKRIKAAKHISVGLNENKQLPQRVCQRDRSFSGDETGSASKSLGAPFVFERQC